MATMNTSIIHSLCGLLAVTVPAQAIPFSPPTLTLIEYCDTLSWSWDNGLGNGTLTKEPPMPNDVFGGSAEHWDAHSIPLPPGPDPFIHDPFVGIWVEPENPQLVNVFVLTGFGLPDGGIADVVSDADYPKKSNDPDPIADGAGQLSEHGTYLVRFHDNGDAVPCPDSGSSILLLAGGLGWLLLCRIGVRLPSPV